MENRGVESYEVLKQALSGPVGVKQLAADLSLSASLVYKWCEPSAGPGAPGTDNPLDRVEQICRRTGDTRPVNWLCGRFGGFFMENPRVDGRAPQALLPVTRRILREFSDLLDVITRSVEDDDQVDAAEARRIRAEWENLKRVAEGFVTACERNDYAGT
jgi:hypothetical protein